MPAKRLWIAMLTMVAALAVSASAQDEKNELTGIVGRTFISDQGVTGINTFDPVLHSGNGLTFEVNYGRHLLSRGVIGLTFEVPFAFNPDEDIHFSVNLVPRQYSSYFITPSIRANIFAENAVSPWISLGGGFGHFGESPDLEFFGTNPGKTGTTVGVLQGGFGLDVRVWRSLSVRGQVRDFYSGIPQLNVDTGKSRQHNLFVGGGVVWHF